MLNEILLIDDGEVSASDVRCLDAPRAPGPLERAAGLEVVIPLAGIFERTIHASGGSRSGVTAIADASRVHVFDPARPFRVGHPLGGADRSIVVSILDGPPGRQRHLSDRPAPRMVHVVARRLAGGVARGRIDALAGGEAARLLVDACLAPDDETITYARRWEGAARRIRLEVAGRLSERLTLPELGRLVGLSGWELARRFRRATGTSIHRYRTMLRVQAALERVDAGERDLTALALDLGFADHSHLANVIGREVGRPPSGFRLAPTPSELASLRTILQAHLDGSAVRSPHGPLSPTPPPS